MPGSEADVTAHAHRSQVAKGTQSSSARPRRPPSQRVLAGSVGFLLPHDFTHLFSLEWPEKVYLFSYFFQITLSNYLLHIKNALKNPDLFCR